MKNTILLPEYVRLDLINISTLYPQGKPGCSPERTAAIDQIVNKAKKNHPEAFTGKEKDNHNEIQQISTTNSTHSLNGYLRSDKFKRVKRFTR